MRRGASSGGLVRRFGYPFVLLAIGAYAYRRAADRTLPARLFRLPHWSRAQLCRGVRRSRSPTSSPFMACITRCSRPNMDLPKRRGVREDLPRSARMGGDAAEEAGEDGVEQERGEGGERTFRAQPGHGALLATREEDDVEAAPAQAEQLADVDRVLLRPPGREHAHHGLALVRREAGGDGRVDAPEIVREKGLGVDLDGMARSWRSSSCRLLTDRHGGPPSVRAPRPAGRPRRR